MPTTRRFPSLLHGAALLACLAAAPACAQQEAAEGPTTRGSHPISRPGPSAAVPPQAGVIGWNTLWVVGVSLGGLGLYSWLRRRPGRLGREKASHNVQVLGRHALGPRHAIYTVRAGGRTLLVGTGSQGPPALLTELDDWIDEPEPTARAAARTESIQPRAAAAPARGSSAVVLAGSHPQK